MLDSIRIRLFQEWYRVVCSLTLHADALHLGGNILCSVFFLPLLARLTGVGRALWLTALGGSLGNAVSLLLRSADVLSMGFSTAVFACIGVQAGIMAAHEQQRRAAFLPLAAALALLAMLGTAGEHTDSVAHCGGLACGLLLGLREAGRRLSRLRQIASALATALLFVGAWYLAFRTSGS